MLAIELINYIKGQISQGITQDTIKTTLLSRGWNESDINQAFSQIGTTTTINSTVQKPLEKPKNIFDFKNLKWYEWLSMLPAFFLMIQGGAIGALLGIIGWSLSLKVIRNQSYSQTKKILIVIALTITYYVIDLITAVIFLSIIRNVFGK